MAFHIDFFSENSAFFFNSNGSLSLVLHCPLLLRFVRHARRFFHLGLDINQIGGCLQNNWVGRETFNYTAVQVNFRAKFRSRWQSHGHPAQISQLSWPNDLFLKARRKDFSLVVHSSRDLLRLDESSDWNVLATSSASETESEIILLLRRRSQITRQFTAAAMYSMRCKSHKELRNNRNGYSLFSRLAFPYTWLISMSARARPKKTVERNTL